MEDLKTACQVLLSLCETVGIRLRRDQVTCSCVCVELKDYQFRTLSHQLTLDVPTDSTTILYETSCKILKEFWDLTPVRLIGVRASKISENTFVQMSLFDTRRSKKLEQVEKAIDSIRSKYGIDSVRRASFLAEDAPVDHAAGKKKHLDLP